MITVGIKYNNIKLYTEKYDLYSYIEFNLAGQGFIKINKECCHITYNRCNKWEFNNVLTIKIKKYYEKEFYDKDHIVCHFTFYNLFNIPIREESIHIPIYNIKKLLKKLNRYYMPNVHIT